VRTENEAKESPAHLYQSHSAPVWSRKFLNALPMVAWTRWIYRLHPRHSIET